MGPKLPGDPGPTPQLGWLPVSRLDVDPSYQRTLDSRRSQKLIAKLVLNFRWDAFGAILAAESDNDRWVIVDGQHRVAAAKRRGLAHVPAVIVKDTLAEQAGAFVRANADRVVVNIYALFHARLQARDADAVEVDRICRGCHLSVPRNPTPVLKPGETLAVGTLLSIVRKNTAAKAEAIIGAVADAYRDRPIFLRACLFRAAEKLLAASPSHKADRGRLTAILRAETPVELFGRVARMRLATRKPEASILADELGRRMTGTAPLRALPAPKPAPQPVRKESTPDLASHDLTLPERVARLVRTGSSHSIISNLLGIPVEEVKRIADEAGAR